MPLYDYRCNACDDVHERLVDRDDDAAVSCPSCGNDCRRLVGRFSLRGGAPKTKDASLASSGGDFMSNTDSFVTAMDTFGEKVGSPLTSKEKERAVERLNDAKK